MDKKSSRMILILTFGVFGILNTEMGIVGILPMIAEQFQVNIATAGWLVSAFALVVAVAGPTMPLICSKMNRKTLMLVSGGIFIITNIISAVAPNFYGTDACSYRTCRISSGVCVNGINGSRKSSEAGRIGKGSSKGVYRRISGNGAWCTRYQSDCGELLFYSCHAVFWRQ